MIIQTREEFDRARTVLLDADVIAIDTETTKTNVWPERHLLGFATYCKIKGREPHTVGFYFPFRHMHNRDLFGKVDNLEMGWLRDILPVLERNDVIWTMHNASFDLAVFRSEGINLVGEIDDTQCIAHLIDENHYSFSLDNLARIYLKEERKLAPSKVEKALGGWEKIPPDVMGQYAITDCKLTFDLREVLLPLLEKEGLTQLWKEQGQKYCRILSQVSENGILLDRKQAQEFAQQAQKRMQELREGLGFDPSKSAEVARILFGPPAEGGLGMRPLALSDRKNSLFPNGIPSTKAEDLQRVALENAVTRELVDQVLEFRRLQKSDSTWFSKFQELAGADDLLHPGFKQHGTKTGRLSSWEPNLQQIPRDVAKSPVKRLFIAPPGFELWEFDYSQLELRLATCYAGQENLKEAYHAGADVHHMTAEMIGSYEVEGISREHGRYVGKEANFLLIYLGGPDTLQAQLWRNGKLLVSLEDCENWHSMFHEAYPNFKKTAYQAMQAAEQRGFIKYWNGRKRHLPWREERSKAFNSLIQGGCGQIVMTTMIMLNEDPRFTSRMVNQVHDSLWIYIKKEESESQRKLITDIMEWPGQEDGFGIPFPVDCKLLADGGE